MEFRGMQGTKLPQVVMALMWVGVRVGTKLRRGPVFLIWPPSLPGLGH